MRAHGLDVEFGTKPERKCKAYETMQANLICSGELDSSVRSNYVENRGIPQN